MADHLNKVMRIYGNKAMPKVVRPTNPYLKKQVNKSLNLSDSRSKVA